MNKIGHTKCCCNGCYYLQFLEKPSDHTTSDWFYDGEDDDGIHHAHMAQCKAAYDAALKAITRPTPEQYLMNKSLVKAGRCPARRVREPPIELDHWHPRAFAEGVCGKPLHRTTGLCAGCHRVYEKESETGEYKRWNGFINEKLPDWAHIYGSKWSEKCKWVE